MRLRLVSLIVTLALGLLAAPLPAEGQKAGKVYRVGILARPFAWPNPAAVGQYLQLFGYVQGKNLVLERRSFRPGEEDRVADLVAELVQLKVDVIVIGGGVRSIRAAKHATGTIPIVMVADGDPVRAGLVASLARPGGNVTGLTTLRQELSGKRLQLLKEAVPGLTRVAVLWNPAHLDREEWRQTQAAARALRVTLQSLEVGSGDDFKVAFDLAIKERAAALLVLADSLTLAYSKRITDLAMRSQLPSMYPYRSFVHLFGSGLMSYGPSHAAVSHRAAAYVDKILKGAKPSDLPIEQPTELEFVINLNTANALGLTIPDSLLFRADRVIK